MVELAQRLGFGEDGIDAAIQVIRKQRLDDDVRIETTMTAQERDPEAARAQDALRLEFVERERSKARRIKAHRLTQRSERRVPVAPFQRGAVDIVLRLRSRAGITDKSSD